MAEERRDEFEEVIEEISKKQREILDEILAELDPKSWTDFEESINRYNFLVEELGKEIKKEERDMEKINTIVEELAKVEEELPKKVQTIAVVTTTTATPEGEKKIRRVKDLIMKWVKLGNRRVTRIKGLTLDDLRRNTSFLTKQYLYGEITPKTFQENLQRGFASGLLFNEELEKHFERLSDKIAEGKAKGFDVPKFLLGRINLIINEGIDIIERRGLLREYEQFSKMIDSLIDTALKYSAGEIDWAKMKEEIDKVEGWIDARVKNFEKMRNDLLEMPKERLMEIFDEKREYLKNAFEKSKEHIITSRIPTVTKHLGLVLAMHFREMYDKIIDKMKEKLELYFEIKDKKIRETEEFKKLERAARDAANALRDIRTHMISLIKSVTQGDFETLKAVLPSLISDRVLSGEEADKLMKYVNKEITYEEAEPILKKIDSYFKDLDNFYYTFPTTKVESLKSILTDIVNRGLIPEEESKLIIEYNKLLNTAAREAMLADDIFNNFVSWSAGFETQTRRLFGNLNSLVVDKDFIRLSKEIKEEISPEPEFVSNVLFEILATDRFKNKNAFMRNSLIFNYNVLTSDLLEYLDLLPEEIKKDPFYESMGMIVVSIPRPAYKLELTERLKNLRKLRDLFSRIYSYEREKIRKEYEEDVGEMLGE